MSDPALSDGERETRVRELMAARRAVRKALAGRGELAPTRGAVDRAKRALGERGPVWWTDGAPDSTRHPVANTSYSGWYAFLTPIVADAALSLQAKLG